VAEPPPGYREVSEADRKKAQGFFAHGRSVAATGNYEYAIEMFLSGFRQDPDDVPAHKELREISLKRKASGGKGLGMMESMKLKKSTKDDKTNLSNAEKLLAYDPGNSDHMLTIAQSAAKAGYYDTAVWAGQLVTQAENDGGKPDANKFLALRDMYKSIQQWKLAVEAVFVAQRLRPLDMDLQTEARDLAARQTMQGAGYDKQGSFRDQVKDMQSQIRLLDADKDVTDPEVQGRMIDEAEKEVAANPGDLGKVRNLIKWLVKTGKPEHDERAIKVLQEWYDKTKQFTFRQQIGQIRMMALKRQEHSKRKAAAVDAAGKKAYEEFRHKQAEFELSEYTLFADAYPTDLSFRYEMGVRQMLLKKYDEAISNFQLARNDPKHRVNAQILLGMAFFEAGFLDEADDTLGALIRDYANTESPKYMDMLYWRGRTLELKAKIEDARKLYSQIFQKDSSYRDVAARLKKLRDASAPAAPPSGEVQPEN
jgi:tetratricopeptide (TPR) repeat protein